MACYLVNKPDECRVVSYRLLTRVFQRNLFPFRHGLLHTHRKLRAAVVHLFQPSDRSFAGHTRDVEVERGNVLEAERVDKEFFWDAHIVDLLKLWGSDPLQKEGEMSEGLVALLH